MTSMGWITCLKGIHGISALGLEFVHEFFCSLAPLIQSIIVTNPIQQLHLPSNEIVTSRVYVMNVGMFHVNDTKHTSDDFFLAIVIDFRITKNCNNLTHLRYQCHISLIGFLNTIPGKGCTRQCNGNTHTNPLRSLTFMEMTKVCTNFMTIGISSHIKRINENRIEMKSLQQRSLPHESLERTRPSLSNDLQPVQINIRKKHLGKCLCLCHPFTLKMCRYM
mmetsp:Transcript_10621/g.19827  ORF Transcript_10621/g.19827 Transcript_10621/m.19827 type:complete len:221 (+) Transcript_10621:1564-2226(+)